jgi:hypothetical protein
MRFRNLSRLEIPKSLWIELAKALHLNSILPQAVKDEYGMYESCKTLRVSLNRDFKKPDKEGGTVTSWYTFGHISIFPCPHCTVGSLTHCYLEALFNAWFDQYHEEFHWEFDTRHLGNQFSNQAYDALGGRNRDNGCANYKLTRKTALANLAAYRQICEHFLSMNEATLKKVLCR